VLPPQGRGDPLRPRRFGPVRGRPLRPASRLARPPAPAQPAPAQPAPAQPALARPSRGPRSAVTFPERSGRTVSLHEADRPGGR
jgi:hypothetical protein